MSANTRVEDAVNRFAAGAITLDQLRASFTPLLVEGIVGPGSNFHFATDLVNVFEDDSLTAAERHRIAKRLSEFVRQGLSEDERRGLLRLVIVQEKLCEVIAKWCNGTISRTGFVSYLGKVRLPGRLKAYLLGGSPENLTMFCANIREHEITPFRSLLTD